MADRFHFNPDTGRTGKCGANVQCRFGQSDSQHGGSREEARANYEATMSNELFANTQTKAPAANVAPVEDFAAILIERQREAYRTGGTVAAPAPATPTPAKPRFTEEQLKEEAWDFESETHYTVEEIIRHRQLTEADAVEADLDYDGWVTVKIPSSSEFSISTELLRRELKRAPAPSRRWY